MAAEGPWDQNEKLQLFPLPCSMLLNGFHLFLKKKKSTGKISGFSPAHDKFFGGYIP